MSSKNSLAIYRNSSLFLIDLEIESFTYEYIRNFLCKTLSSSMYLLIMDNIPKNEMCIIFFLLNAVCRYITFADIILQTLGTEVCAVLSVYDLTREIAYQYKR